MGYVYAEEKAVEGNEKGDVVTEEDKAQQAANNYVAEDTSMMRRS